MIGEGCQLQIRYPLDIPEQSFLLLDLPLDPALHGLDPGLHFLGLRTDIGAGGDIPVRLLRGVEADLGGFVLIRPAGSPVRRSGELPDLLLMLLIFRDGESVRTFLILPPAAEISGLHLDGGAVQDQDVVRTGIQQIPVMGNQDISLLGSQIFLDDLPRSGIQMIGRLIDQQEISLAGEEHRQHHLCPFAVAECPERTVQKLRFQG